VSTKKSVPKVEGLFTWPAEKPQLIGSKCKKCGAYSFPKSLYCPNPDCEKNTENVEVVQLSNRAKLFTWAIQSYPPPEPFKMDPFEPFVVGMLDLPEGLRILGMLTTDKVDFGMEMEMTTKKLYEDEENEYLTWAWKPVGE
jgi:uncharacterized OB-fold protein